MGVVIQSFVNTVSPEKWFLNFPLPFLFILFVLWVAGFIINLCPKKVSTKDSQYIKKLPPLTCPYPQHH